MLMIYYVLQPGGTKGMISLRSSSSEEQGKLNDRIRGLMLSICSKYNKNVFPAELRADLRTFTNHITASGTLNQVSPDKSSGNSEKHQKT